MVYTLALHQASCVFLTLADRWSSVQVQASLQGSPFMSCADLNELATIQHCGALFMEGEPREISDLKRELHLCTDAFVQASQWLEQAMQST